MGLTRVICPCGVPVSSPEHWHKSRLVHECIWHDSPSCRVCITVEQIQDYLYVAVMYGTAEAEQLFREETKGVWD